jgi:hypothetical protein
VSGMSLRIDTLIAELERQEKALTKTKKPSALDQLRLLAIRCDLAVRRRDRATHRLEELRAQVEEAKRELVDARATGQGERRALSVLERAEQTLHDRDLELAPLVYAEQLKRATAAWVEFRDVQRKRLAAEIEARGEAVLKRVVEARALMAAAAHDWQQLDHDGYALVRADYRTGSHGSGDLPPFPGLEGPLRPAVPLELQPLPVDPTIRAA